MTIKQALSEARKNVSDPLSYGKGQWTFCWNSRRGREQATPASYWTTNRSRSARIAGYAAEALAKARGLDDYDAASYAEHLVYEGATAEEAVRRTLNTYS